MSDLDGLLAVDPGSLSGEELSDAMIEFEPARTMLAAVEARIGAAWDRQQVWSEDSALSGATWLSKRTRCRQYDARTRLRRAGRLAAMKLTTEALEHSEMTATHAEMLADLRTCDLVEVFDRDERILVRLARQSGVDDFAKALLHWKRHADPHRFDEDTLDHHAARSLHHSQGYRDRWHTDICSDPEAGAQVARVLDAKTDELLAADRREARGTLSDAELDAHHGDPAGLIRTSAQRRHDALLELLLLGAAADPAVVRRTKTKADVVVDLSHLVDRGCGHGAGQGASLPGCRPGSCPMCGILAEPDALFGRCRLSDGTAISLDDACRMLCDSAITRITLDAAGTIVDVGEPTPTINRAQRRALEYRDGGCAHPYCDRPPTWCDAHHIQHRADNGPTDLDNLTLLCRRHHTLLHRKQFTIEGSPSTGLRFRRPDGQEIGGREPPDLS